MQESIKERPILFSAPMVRALLDGSKTQTRRIVKPQCTLSDKTGFNWKGWAYGIGFNYFDTVRNFAAKNCPYGKVGDRLWVRETFQPVFADGFDHDSSPYPNYKTGYGYAVTYPATDEIIEWIDGDDNITSRCRPSIHMPRWASRITLEITGVRVERLNDISESDAQKEGIKFTDYGLTCFHQGRAQDVGDCTAPDSHHQKRNGWHWGATTHQDQCYSSAKYAFGALWDSIYKNWDQNPWVWVVEFKVIK